MTNSQRVVIFGGSFDPPTMAHEAILRACLALPQFDAVWAMPSRSREDKVMANTEAHRLQMLRVLQQSCFAAEPRLQISDFELKLPAPTRTAHTIPALEAAYPGVEFWFAMGGDSYRNMAQWPEAETFMHDIHVVLFTEDGTGITEGERLVHLHLPKEVWEMSSTNARAALAAGQDASDLVRKPVLDYIAEHQLYQR